MSTAAQGAPRAQEIAADGRWRALDFISDLHLQAGAPRTLEAWRAYLDGTTADAVFILGDLFDAWPGDDAALAPGFAADCAEILRAAAARRPLFFLHGNRDFLVGEGLLGRVGVRLLQDPSVLAFAQRRWLLTHGDALCLDDVDYLRFRAQVRDPAWQVAFLARPLAERLDVALALRRQSQEAQRGLSRYPDVDAQAALQWLRAADADVMIHGHTHRPGEHALDGTHRRVVLADWDADAQPPRLEALRLHADARLERVPLA